MNSSRLARATGKRAATGHGALALGICSTGIYVTSAIISFLVSSSQGVGREKLTFVLVGLLLPLALVVLLRRRVETQIGMLGALLGLLAPIIGLVGVLVVMLADPLADIWQINVNTVAVTGAVSGALSLLIPLAGCGLVWALARKYRPLQIVLWSSIAIAAVITIASGEHAAILGLAVGVVFGYGLLWRLRVAPPSRWLQLLDVSVITLAVLSLGVYLLLILFPDQMAQLWDKLPFYYAQRFSSWRDTPAIINDYLFTGSGLGAAPMVLSSYLYLVHVPYFHHIHNLFLQVGIEQGIPGIIGITGMFVAAFWSMVTVMRRAHAYLALCAASVFASLISLFVSGLLESDVYASAAVIIMFLPFGFTWVIALHDVSAWAARNRAPDRMRARDVVIGVIPLVLVLILIAWPGSQTQWLANRAALAQTWEELSDYVPNLSPNQDQLRRDAAVDLDEAVALYRQALLSDPHNPTALRRLAQIQIARGEYDAALLNLELAYQVAPGERATRQMLGELYARAGRSDEGLSLWRTIDVAPELLKNRLWWYNFIGDWQAAEHISSVLQRLGL
jgi:hypothetical protein